MAKIGSKEQALRALREGRKRPSKPRLATKPPKAAPKPSRARPKRSALSMQQIGGRARAKALTQERRIEIAKAASEARWRKQEPVT
jgi:hypothetical protein